jgi:hypothetical protein
LTPIRYEHWPEAKVLRRVRLRPEHQPTGRTRHYKGGQLLPAPSELVLCRHDSLWRPTMAESARMHASYSLYYLDAAGAEMTDLAPLSLDDGLAQAEYEFGIQPEDWEIVGDDTPL